MDSLFCVLAGVIIGVVGGSVTVLLASSDKKPLRDSKGRFIKRT